MLIDEFLWLFDAKSELEGFLSEGQSCVKQHFVGIAGAVSNSEHADGCLDGAGGRVDCRELPAFKVKSLQPAAEAVFTAEGFDVAAVVAADHREFIAAEVWAMFVDERGSAAAFNKALEDPVDIGARDATGEFAVAEAASTAFAEEVVVFVVVWSAAVEASNCRDSFAHWLSAFDDEWPVATEGEEVSGEEAGGAGANDDGAFRERVGAGLWVIKTRGIPRFNSEPVTAFQGLGWGGIGVEEQAVDEFESVAIASIKTFAEDADLGYVCG